MESQFGAPVTKEEINKIEKILPVVKEYLPKEHIKEIEKRRILAGKVRRPDDTQH